MTTVLEPGTQHRAGALTIHPLQPTIGAKISGVDLREPLSPSDRDQIKAAILEYKVIFFRNHELDRDQHAAFAAQFGPLYTHPSVNKPYEEKVPALHQISAAHSEKYQKIAAARAAEGWDPYHTDTSWRLVPAWGAVLRAVTLPDVGGDTVWVDAGKAYESLPDEVKERLEGLHATHDFRSSLQANGHDYPIVAHPIVRVHRETGEKILWVNFTQYPWIVGFDRAESRELLSIIHDQYRKPEHQVRFNWKPGSIAFWDNRAAVHYAVRNYGDFPRLLERILIADEPQYADL
ncbi:MAG: TauD/TfdA family dioxygenase [Acidimicrobiales bacterium]|jgi:taurine dioxygenase